MEWQSPWGVGFPGWHTECVVMAKKVLGCPFDIHCGGIDHIPIHHTNEIAQSQAAFGNNLANVWLHGEFLNLSGIKMSKSKGNIITLDTLAEKGFNPLAYRYLCLTAHYRSKLVFTWQNIQAAANGLSNLYQQIQNIGGQPPYKVVGGLPPYKTAFLQAVNDDLNMPKALAVLWQALADKKLTAGEKYCLAVEFDKVLGLDLASCRRAEKSAAKPPAAVLRLAGERENARQNKNWSLADQLRKQIAQLDWQIKDTAQGAKITKI